MPTIFISYSHEDSSLVRPVVALLRASNALVFQDADSIRPGKRWREEIGTAISSASVVVVFWCRHARASNEVENEITAAISQHKDILPLLLDETPLPSELAEFQYIDFRQVFRGGHGFGQDRPVPRPAKRRKALWWVIGVLVIVLIWPSAGLSRASLPDYTLPLMLFLGIALVVFTVLWWRLRDHLRDVVLALSKSLSRQFQAGDSERWVRSNAPREPVMLARAIEEELLRRTGARAP